MMEPIRHTTEEWIDARDDAKKLAEYYADEMGWICPSCGKETRDMTFIDDAKAVVIISPVCPYCFENKPAVLNKGFRARTKKNKKEESKDDQKEKNNN